MDARGAEVLQEVAPWIFNFSEAIFFKFRHTQFGKFVSIEI